MTYLLLIGKFTKDLPHMRNTGIQHALFVSIQLSWCASGGNLLTADNNQLWFDAISVGTLAMSFTNMTFPYNDLKPLTDPWHNTMNFDTESSGLFLPSLSCGSSCFACSGHWHKTMPIHKDNLTYKDKHQLVKIMILYKNNADSQEQCWHRPCRRWIDLDLRLGQP